MLHLKAPCDKNAADTVKTSLSEDFNTVCDSCNVTTHFINVIFLSCMLCIAAISIHILMH